MTTINNSQIELLKIKPFAKKYNKIEIILKNDLENSDDFIIDKTKDNLVDKYSFLELIKNNLEIENKIKFTKPKIYEKISKEIEKKEEIENEIKADKIKSDIFITNILKTKKKIIIHQILNLDDPIILDNIRITPKPVSIEMIDIPKDLKIGRTLYFNRIPKEKPKILIKASEYYLNNREIFISFINSLFDPYKQKLIKEEEDMISGKKTLDCNANSNDDFSLLTHQKIVRDYINIYTPYRGLLLFHGLGSGKTCSSIAIAEGLKNDKKVLVMTPASLRSNYKEELKKCGDYLYKKNQFWEFININKYPDLLKYLSSILNLPEDYIKKNNGAWFINVKKEPNYDSLTFSEQKKLDEQIDIMIERKYEFINYNGLRLSHLDGLSKNNTINPFSNRIIIIDEAHNFISRIVNKLKRPKSLSIKMYEYLMSAENTKIIFLTGTPIINYPHEIAILFNILRGYIKSYNMKISPGASQTINKDKIIKMFKESNIEDTIDTIELNSDTITLTLTQNPFKFISNKTNKNKVEYTKDKNLTSEEFIDNIKQCLKKNKIEIIGNKINIDMYKALPDNMDEFKSLFINESFDLQNTNMFKMRIMGLTSYFRSAQEELMPKYDPITDFKVIEIEMSNFQFGVYEEARIQERKLEESNKKKKSKKKQEDDLYNDSVSTYRIFSRAFCNFVFPKPDIRRPMPNDGENIESILDKENVDEDVIDNINVEDKINNADGKYEADDLKDIKEYEKKIIDDSYDKRIMDALKQLKLNSDKYLTKTGLQTYSPKFLHILENISDSDFKGIHLIYSQFRTLEGIGIFKLVLDQNGYTEFKIKKDLNGEYILDIDKDDIGKEMYALYTGTETPEEKEIIRNVLNSNWKLVPASLVKDLLKISPNNFMGRVIKVLMITASGAEGITLKNVRYVHIMEPYWHPVRITQVIGRARRICSHTDLPKELQTVEVFLYLMKFSDEILKGDASIELRLKDKSKIDKSKVVSSDQLLYEISTLKQNITDKILKNVKESAIDCNIHTRSKSKELIQCFSIGNPNESNYMYVPNIKNQDKDEAIKLNIKKTQIKGVEIEINGVKYVYDPDESRYSLEKYYRVYDHTNYVKNKELLEVGRIIKEDGKMKFIKI